MEEFFWCSCQDHKQSWISCPELKEVLWILLQDLGEPQQKLSTTWHQIKKIKDNLDQHVMNMFKLNVILAQVIVLVIFSKNALNTRIINFTLNLVEIIST